MVWLVSEFHLLFQYASVLDFPLLLSLGVILGPGVFDFDLIGRLSGVDVTGEGRGHNEEC